MTFSLRYRPALPAAGLTLLAALTAPALHAAPASASCATNSHRIISGQFYGQDRRDVNVSIGFDVVDKNYRGINADPATSDYGCAKNGNHGGYSLAQHEYNHYVSANGAAAGSAQKDGTRTVRSYTLSNLPSNAAYVWVEVYARGYQGSPCTTCFNPSNVSRYGYANRQWIPVGAVKQDLVLPLTCAQGGQTGSISGRVVDSSGRAVALAHVYAWTAHRYNVGPYPQGWGIASLGRQTGTFSLPSLAGGQPYTVWATATSGRTIALHGAMVHGCQNTAVTLRG